MKKFLLLLSLVGFVVVVGAWLYTGASFGWSANQVQVMQRDPVTEMEFPTWEPRLVLGIDFLSLGLLGSAVLAALSFFVPSKKPQP